MIVFGPNFQFATAGPTMNPTAVQSFHICEVRPRKDKRGVDLISDALPFGQRDRNARAQGRFQRTLEPLTGNFFESHAKAGVVDHRCPTIRFCKCADFFHTRYTRRTFYLFGRPTTFKPILENHTRFPLPDALSNEFGELVLRIRNAGSFLKHVLGGDDPLLQPGACQF
jgi:hypothetical protein